MTHRPSDRAHREDVPRGTRPPPGHTALRDALPGILRGIEREALRVDAQGSLAATPHPAALGSALTHPRITTDYSEALLELITGTHGRVEDLLGELDAVHRFVAGHLSDETMWAQSMPCVLPGEPDIPIAWYGTSHSGMLRHVYRRGLAERYGRAMQCIAGLHYNFSLPDAAWDACELPGESPRARRDEGYLALIRNFTRYSWLLMYLFGASPAVSAGFLAGKSHDLSVLDEDTLFLPYATSLRMSDLGYQNKAQSELQLCYNDLPTFLQRLYHAVQTPWPAYEAIGTHRDGQWIQLNTNILQIENEYYSNIRPKRTTARGERPATALQRHGVQYVEVRCLDIDPWEPLGISASTVRLLDAFLLFCALEPSPLFELHGNCPHSRSNFATVVREGRRPGLMLRREGEPVSLRDWGQELIDRMAPYAALLDEQEGRSDAAPHAAALARARACIDDTALTPSARLLAELRDGGLSLHEHALRTSRDHQDSLSSRPLPADEQAAMTQAAAASLQAQHQLEASDCGTFDDYVARYQAALPPL